MSAPHFSLIGRLTRLLHTTDGTAPGSSWGTGALAGYDYAYDAATRLTGITSFVDGATTYTHDNTSQLTGADHTGQTDENYAYDENGNRTGGSYVTGDNNQTTEDGVYTYTYDAEGNRLTRTRVSDSFVTAYEWDHRNRLVSVTELDDEEAVLAETIHDYDAFNQWIRRTVDADGPGSGDPASNSFAHHDGQIVYQLGGDTADDLTNRYLWNASTVDHLLVDEVVANLSTAGDLQFPLGDHLGTVRDIAEYDAGTDTTTIANHIRYSSFGAVISETNSAIDLLFGFTSRPFDDSTGLQNNLHRWYDAALGQWASEDPIGFAGGDSNHRRYVHNRTGSHVDPIGLWDWPNPFSTADQYLGGALVYAVAGGDKIYYEDMSITDIYGNYLYGGLVVGPTNIFNAGTQGVAELFNQFHDLDRSATETLVRMNPLGSGEFEKESDWSMLAEASAQEDFNYTAHASRTTLALLSVGISEQAITAKECFVDGSISIDEASGRFGVVGLSQLGTAGAMQQMGGIWTRPLGLGPKVNASPGGYVPNPTLNLIGQAHGLAAEAAFCGNTAVSPVQGMYGPFWHSANPAIAAQIVQSRILTGEPPTNFFSSSISKVKAYPFAMPDGANGVQFYTNVPPSEIVPIFGGQVHWNGPLNAPSHSIPIVISKSSP